MAERTSKDICGNSLARREAFRLTDPRTSARSVALVGPGHVGKHSYVLDRLSDLLSESDFSTPSSDVEGVREAREFLSSGPLFSAYKGVLFDDADRMSEPAQDALLKLLEEPPDRSRTVLVVEDEGALLPALQDRLEHVVRWSPLTDPEMREFASDRYRVDEDVLRLCRGRPGLYPVLLEDPGYVDLYKHCAAAISGKVDAVLSKVPAAISSLKSGRSVERDAVSHTIIAAVSEFRADASLSPKLRSFLRLASDLIKIPSLNAEIHWRRACIGPSSRAV